MADTLESALVTMRGIIVDQLEGGTWLADMNYPERLQGVELPADVLCLTRGYSNPRARARLTDLHIPDTEVRVGKHVTAQVSTLRGETGEMEVVKGRYWDEQDYTQPQIAVFASHALRWGVVEPS